MSKKKESRNRKISRVPSAHFPTFETVDKSIDDQMFGAQSIMEKGVYSGEEYDPLNHPSDYNQFGIECLVLGTAQLGTNYGIEYKSKKISFKEFQSIMGIA